MRTTPSHMQIEDTTSPWPKRSQDSPADSSSGSCWRVLPAPSPPMATRIAPPNPIAAARPAGDRRNEDTHPGAGAGAGLSGSGFGSWEGSKAFDDVLT
ncbi:Uncharacterised protein [Mycobacteroides abscessus subsp. abscessus]|nr:Uncharacterised protein [Mycobacteroides abscessus subsp. abscessus]